MNDDDISRDIARYDRASEAIYWVAIGLAVAIVILVLTFARLVIAAEAPDQYDIRQQQVSLWTTLPFGAAVGNLGDGRIVGGRPAQCPRRYCGCYLSLDLFGKRVRDLDRADNWPKYFKRTKPAPGMIAARRGHAMKLIAQVRGKLWQVLDPNSGKGLTRIHTRSIAGFVIVDPNSRKA